MLSTFTKPSSHSSSDSPQRGKVQRSSSTPRFSVVWLNVNTSDLDRHQNLLRWVSYHLPPPCVKYGVHQSLLLQTSMASYQRQQNDTINFSYPPCNSSSALSSLLDPKRQSLLDKLTLSSPDNGRIFSSLSRIVRQRRMSLSCEKLI